MDTTRLLLVGGALLALLITSASAALVGTSSPGRQAISVGNPSGTDGLEIFFNATYLPGMRPDFADIRFVDGNGTNIPTGRKTSRRVPTPTSGSPSPRIRRS